MEQRQNRKGFAKRFRKDQDGAVLAETLIVVPVMLVLTFGILEFGNMLWNRMQMQVGVRDAARYWSRCPSSFSTCSETIARNIAFYGHPAGASGGSLRVPGWNQASQLTISPDAASLPIAPAASDLVSMTATTDYQGSPAVRAIFDGTVSMTYRFETRFIGW
ncbi:MAG: pilus assembly protein [Natronospirillum sp.]